MTASPTRATARWPMPLTNCTSVSYGIDAWKRSRISVERAKEPRPKYARITASVGATWPSIVLRTGVTLTTIAPMSRPLVITVVDEMKRYGLLKRYATSPPRSLIVGSAEACMSCGTRRDGAHDAVASARGRIDPRLDETRRG